MKLFFCLLSPYLISIALAFFAKDSWFSILPTEQVVATALVFITIQTFVFYFQRSIWNTLLSWNKTASRLMVFILFLLFTITLLYPFRNLSWGDGLILFETNLLETKLFGLQIALDEIIETSLHSLAYHLLNYSGILFDIRLSYQLISYTAGIFFLALVGWYLPKYKSNQDDFFPKLIFFGSGGYLVFFGYAENYSYLSLYIFFLLIYLRKMIEGEISSKKLLLSATILVTIGIFFHLVTGFLAVLLGYLWYKESPRERKVKDLFQFSALGFGIIAIGFVYLLFIHDPNVDRQSSHLLHPPLYPLKRLISINHFKEVLSVLWWNSKPAIFVLLYFFLYDKKIFKTWISRRENAFLFVAFLSFLLNGFFINPMLGFPGDWDMTGFYWIPLAFLGYLALLEYPNVTYQVFPLLVFCLIMQIFHAKKLSETNPESEAMVRITENLVTLYVAENQEKVNSLPSSQKKFYAKTDFFLYKADRITSLMCDFNEKENLKKELQTLRKEFQSSSQEGKLKDKTWIKGFLYRATDGNTKYIKSLKEHKLCHLGV
ncbi:dolichyl-phosphate-mannose-protein mannosyltransferase [Leptospira ryugenii]|uniref:Dolichyl-phosphate-mannose-protein mannosyltransferase n=1 Tax=Leptospira ryugenii TaxID=1917863 RepID=A0A2P2E142_9LEPT|nr:dolichyl-phosphate-mannose--protein mannosyltransferase [Leptospira ryugenii]GBF50589.1 dolichyl-phosphate-mannose-protein mannosyltransferase [Leptospira ryugenii]